MKVLTELKTIFPDIEFNTVTEHFVYYTLPSGKFQTKMNGSTMEVDGLIMIDSDMSKWIEGILKCLK